jgi:hypothetical protein
MPELESFGQKAVKAWGLDQPEERSQADKILRRIERENRRQPSLGERLVLREEIRQRAVAAAREQEAKEREKARQRAEASFEERLEAFQGASARRRRPGMADRDSRGRYTESSAARLARRVLTTPAQRAEARLDTAIKAKESGKAAPVRLDGSGREPPRPQGTAQGLRRRARGAHPVHLIN